MLFRDCTIKTQKSKDADDDQVIVSGTAQALNFNENSGVVQSGFFLIDEIFVSYMQIEKTQIESSNSVFLKEYKVL